MRKTTFNTIALAAAIMAACGAAATAGPGKAEITITSAAFQAGHTIPDECTCKGANTSPPLEWTGVPAGAKSLALICEDPDAPSGTWTHWVIYDIPTAVTGLPAKTPTTSTLPTGANQGMNDFKRMGYSGPCPPPGKVHRYFFKIYALDMEIALKPGATKDMVMRAMSGHIIGEGQIAGTYQRSE